MNNQYFSDDFLDNTAQELYNFKDLKEDLLKED